MQPTEGPPVEHVTVYGSASGSVRSASPNVQTTLANPMLAVQQTQATAFVQPTQQQSVSHAEPANQEPPSAVVEATTNSQVERPSTSSVFGTGEFTLICFKRVTLFFYSHPLTRLFCLEHLQYKIYHVISSLGNSRNIFHVQETSGRGGCCCGR